MARSTLAGETARITLQEVSYVWGYKKKDRRVGFRDIVQYKVFDLPFNVRWLITDWDFGQSRQVDEGKVEYSRTIYLQIDRQF